MANDAKMSPESSDGWSISRSMLLLAGLSGLLIVGGVASYLTIFRQKDEPTIDSANGTVSDPDRRDRSQADTLGVQAAVDIAEGTGLDSPVAVEIPGIDDGIGQWLQADGEQLLQFTGAVVPLWSEGEATCTEVADALSAVGDPTEIEAVALSAPDPLVADVAGGLYRTAARALLACGTGAEFEARRAELAWQWALTTRVFDAAGGS